MGAVMRYTMQDWKTEFKSQRLVTGINCQPETVYADFMMTKRLYHKTDGVLFYHMVQSFPKGEAVDPATAHTAALKLAEYYEGHEVLVSTHTDRDHIHSHFLINSVNFDTGKKLHIAKEQLQELRQRNDQVCMEFSLPVFRSSEAQKRTKAMTAGEYHTAARGQSKKLQLMNIINDCMRQAANREEFIALMESEGCKVRWEKDRKNITYTAPSGWRCRDRLLFGNKYLKENMEDEFRLREEIIHGRADGKEPASPEGEERNASYERGMGGTVGRALHTGLPRRAADQRSEGDLRPTGALPDPNTDERVAEADGTSGNDGRTGWETERELFFSARHQTTQAASAAPGRTDSSIFADGVGSLVHDVVVLGQAVERLDEPAPLILPSPVHIDKKRWKKLKEKKIALGHKKDDHGDEKIWQQNM